MRYKAFISYRHGGIDEQVAVQLHKEIEKYRVPGKIAKKVGEKRLGRVFRDADELQAASDLSGVIREALDESEWLIVIATPRYIESKWCLEEIEYFLQIRDRNRILVVLAEGEPEDSFPDVLTHVERDGEVVEIEPLAVDVRGETPRDMVKNVRRERFRLFAPMLGVAYDDLRQRQRERRMRRIVALTTVAFVILGGVIAVVTVKNIQLNQAYTALDESNQETLRGESYYLAEYAEEAFRNGDTMTSLMLSLEALPEDFANPDRPFVPKVMHSLTQALGVYDYRAGCKPGAFFESEGENYDIRTQVSEAGDRIRIESYTYAAGNILNRNVRICTLPDGKELFRTELSSVGRNTDHPDASGSWMTGDGSRLIYLDKEGLHCVDIDSGREVFAKKDPADELKVGAHETRIVTIDYEGHRLRSYDETGEPGIDGEIGDEMNYSLGDLSPSEKQVALSANTETLFGIITIDLETGQTGFIDMPGFCSHVEYLDEDRLCFLLSDETDGLKHIVKYDLGKGDQSYLCNADWDMTTMTLTERQSCLYYHENRVIEVDCNSAKGDKLWEYVFPSPVVSVKAGGGIIAVSCTDGSVYFFEADEKKWIDLVQGNGDAFTLLTVDDRIVTLRDFWGQTLRVYRWGEKDAEPGITLKGGKPLKSAPDTWYTCGTTGNTGFAMGFQKEAEGTIASFSFEKSGDGSTVPVLSGATSLVQLGFTSFDSLSVEQREYLWVQDYDRGMVYHIDDKNMKIVMEIDDDNHFFYTERGETVYVAKKKGTSFELKTYEASSGKETGSEELPGNKDRGLWLGDVLVAGDDRSILIRRGDGETELTDAVLSGCNEAGGLFFYRSVDESRWYVYAVSQDRVVCEGSSGAYTNTTVFGENRYLLVDYRTVYDMNTWKPVLELSELGNSVYGVMTTASLPYFAVWCQGSDTSGSEHASGSGTVYLYEKDGGGEIVGEVPNFVSMTPEGKLVVYDGEYDLYELSLLSAEELKAQAERKVGSRTFSEAQRERYHLFE